MFLTKFYVCGFAVSSVAFCLFQFAPSQIISIFGNGSEEYYQFATSYFRIFRLQSLWNTNNKRHKNLVYFCDNSSAGKRDRFSVRGYSSIIFQRLIQNYIQFSHGDRQAKGRYFSVVHTADFFPSAAFDSFSIMVWDSSLFAFTGQLLLLIIAC